jgi:chromosome partitioning protein
MKIVAVYNLKGGVGKTAAAVNLAYLASQEGYRTLLLDLDPQGSSSFYFRIRPSKKFNAKKFAKGKNLHKHIKETDYPNLDLLPADFSFRTLDIIFDDDKNPNRRLSKVISQIDEDYDLIFIDTPASIGVESENVFYAADKLIIPLVPTVLSIESYQKVFEFYAKNKIDTSAILAFFSMMDGRKKMHRDIFEQYTSQGPRYMQTAIPYASDVEQMGSYRAPLVLKYPNSKSGKAFKSLWNELKGRIMVKQDTVFFTEPKTEAEATRKVEAVVRENPDVENGNGLNIH